MDILDQALQATMCELHSGEHFDIKNPVFDIQDISYALSNLCRFNGHCSEFYSVAEHSVLVAWLLAEWDQSPEVIMQGLMHDATEAYLSDVPAPFKQLLPDWRALDEDLEEKLWKHFNLGEKSPMVKKADWYAVFIEANQLLPSKGEWFNDPMDVRSDAIMIQPPCELGGNTRESVQATFLLNFDNIQRYINE